MEKKNDNGDEPENQNTGESHIPNEAHKVTTDSVSFHITKTQSMHHSPRTHGQAFRYFKYFFAWILKLGFRTILVNLLIIGICCYIFWESGKDTLLIEPFEVPEDLAKEGYTGKAIANKLVDQMNYIKGNSEIVLTLTPVFSSKSNDQNKKEQRPIIEKTHVLFPQPIIEKTHPLVIPTWSQTEQIDIQIPGVGISLNSIIQYVKKLRHHEPMRVIGEITRHDENKLEVTVRVKEEQLKLVPEKIENLNHQLLLAAKHIYKYTRPIILAGYMVQNEKNEKNDSQCIEIIRNIISQDAHRDQHYYAYAMWGYVLQRLRKYDEAIEKYGYAVEKAGKDKQKLASTYNNLAYIMGIQWKFNEAIEYYKKATETDSTSASAYIGWGNVLTWQGKYDEAIKKYQKAIEINPKDTYAYVYLGSLLASQGKYDEATEKYQKAIEINPKDTYTYVNWGSVLVSQGKYDEATEKYQKAIEINPKDTYAYGYWGYSLVSQGKYDEAIEKYRKAIEINPKDTYAYVYLGSLLASQGKYDEAIEKYREAIEINPKDTSAYVSWGEVLERQEKYDEAIGKYRNAIELDTIGLYKSYKERIDELQKGWEQNRPSENNK